MLSSLAGIYEAETVKPMSELGAIFYRGPSLLTGDPIVGILTGLEGARVCTRCGDDFIQERADQKLCAECATPRQACAGGCGRLVIADMCPDCKLARQRARFARLHSSGVTNAETEEIENALV